MKMMNRVWNKIFVILLCSFSFIFSYPMADDENHLSSQSGYEIYEGLKSGDHEMWETAGPYVVDLVNTMIENGEAATPVHALLRIFWPELSTEEQTETLARVEPMVQSLYRGLWNVHNDRHRNAMALASASRADVHHRAGLQKRNPESVISLKEALKNLKQQSYADDDVERR